MDAKIPLTVLVGVKNEAPNIVGLRSLTGVDQVVVVDSCSVDRTRELAQCEGAEVYDFDYDGGWPKKRNWPFKIYRSKTIGFLFLTRTSGYRHR